MDTNKCYVYNCELIKKRKGDMDTNVCIDCRKQKDIFLSKTKALKKYFLTDEDLEELFSMHVHNNTYGKSQTITLYLIKDIVEAANRKYGSFEEYKKNKEENKQERAKIRKEKKELTINSRKKIVKSIFDKHNLEYELDETLKLYIREGFAGLKKFNDNNRKFKEEELPKIGRAHV